MLWETASRKDDTPVRGTFGMVQAPEAAFEAGSARCAPLTLRVPRTQIHAEYVGMGTWNYCLGHTHHIWVLGPFGFGVASFLESGLSYGSPEFEAF